MGSGFGISNNFDNHFLQDEQFIQICFICITPYMVTIT